VAKNPGIMDFNADEAQLVMRHLFNHRKDALKKKHP